MMPEYHRYINNPISFPPPFLFQGNYTDTSNGALLRPSNISSNSPAAQNTSNSERNSTANSQIITPRQSDKLLNATPFYPRGNLAANLPN